MPTYQYRCKECGHDLEVVQSFHDEALTTCPECSGALKKVYGNVGISFKGSGFYKNDARSGSKKSSSSSSSTDSTTTKTESTTTSDTKKTEKSSESKSSSTTSSSD